MEAMKQHNHLQQELLQHVLQASPSLEAPNKADTGSGQELAASLGMDTLMGSMVRHHKSTKRWGGGGGTLSLRAADQT